MAVDNWRTTPRRQTQPHADFAFIPRHPPSRARLLPQLESPSILLVGGCQLAEAVPIASHLPRAPGRCDFTPSQMPPSRYLDVNPDAPNHAADRVDDTDTDRYKQKHGF